MGKICPSEKSRQFILLFVVVMFLPTVMRKVTLQKWALKEQKKKNFYPVLSPRFRPCEKSIYLKGESDPLQTARNRKSPTERGKKQEVEFFKS